VAGPESERERSWNDIQARLSRGAERSHRPGRTGLRWALAAASAGVIFVAAFLVGKYGFRASFETAAPPARSSAPHPNGIGPAFASHLDDVKPILLDYAHYQPGEGSGREIVVDEDELRGLVLQNVLLKKRLAERDPAAAEFLDDLELVLREITNRGTGNADSPAEIRDLIERRDLLFKMEILKKF
jgi:hypothetical protein